MALYTLLLAFGASKAYAQTVDQPYWPANCANFQDDFKTSVRIEGPRNLLGSDFYNCYQVGNKCTSNDDCTVPNTAACEAAAPGNPGPYLPPQTKCIDGFCRFRTSYENAACDCLTGCEHETAEGKLLSCIGGRCKAAECAKCGEKPDGKLCCAPGVVDQDGKCYCATGVGEGCQARRDACVDDDYDCCARTTDNDGFCCKTGTCNGKCIVKEGFN